MCKDLFKSWLVEKPIAHRGLHTDAQPENTLGAFQNAINHGVPIELDVQEIADGTLVVFHDKKLERLTGQDGYLKNLSAANLENYKILGTEFSIPTLQSVLQLIAGQVPVLFEIKNENKIGSLERSFCKAIKSYQGEFAIQSFNPFTLEWFKKHAPHIIRGQIASYMKKENLAFFKKFFLKRMSFNKKISEPHFISYCAQDLPNRYVKKYKSLPLLAWTVRSQEEYLSVLKYCDNIIFENFEPRI